MRIPRAFALLTLSTMATCALALQASADPTPSMMAQPSPQQHAMPASELIHVSACSAALNINQTGGWYGYTPGWYGGRWADPWGGMYYQPSTTTANPQLAIDYKNVSPKVMTEIQFGLVANGILKAEVRDVGKFSPHAEIKHKFGIPGSTFPIGTGLPQCVPLHIAFADGTKWRNPALPPKNPHIYLNP